MLLIKAVVGVGILCRGYSLAMRESRTDVMRNALAAVVLVIVGVVLLFG